MRKILFFLILLSQVVSAQSLDNTLTDEDGIIPHTVGSSGKNAPFSLFSGIAGNQVQISATGAAARQLIAFMGKDIAKESDLNCERTIDNYGDPDISCHFAIGKSGLEALKKDQRGTRYNNSSWQITGPRILQNQDLAYTVSIEGAAAKMIVNLAETGDLPNQSIRYSGESVQGANNADLSLKNGGCYHLNKSTELEKAICGRSCQIDRKSGDSCACDYQCVFTINQEGTASSSLL